MVSHSSYPAVFHRPMCDDLDFEQSDEASDRHVATGFGEPFCVSYGQILHASAVGIVG